MDRIILRTPQMALRLAEILFPETQSPRKLEWFEPLTVEDQGDVWHVFGHIDPEAAVPPQFLDNEFENHTYEMYASKADAKVKNILISVAPKLTPEMKNEIRQILAADGSAVSDLRAQHDHSAGIWLSDVLHGGVINSAEAAVSFGGLVFEDVFSLAEEKTWALRAELVEGIWHVYGRVQDHSAEAVFRRSNAQVISLDLRPV